MKPALELWHEACFYLKFYYFGHSTLRLAPKIRRMTATLIQDLRGKRGEFKDAHRYIEELRGAIADSHTLFHNADEYSKLVRIYSGKIQYDSGFGLDFLTSNDSGTEILINEVLADSPAAMLGIQPFDRVVRVNKKRLSSKENLNWYLSQVSFVELLIARGSVNNPIEFQVSLQKTRLPDLKLPYVYRYSPPSQTTPIFVLRIPSFRGNKSIAPRVHQLVRQIQEIGAKSLILDLRGNDGGAVSECYGAASAFVLEAKNLSQTRLQSYTVGYDGWRCMTNDPRDQKNYDIPEPAFWQGKTVVLVNLVTSSCGEVMANLLQRHQILVLGETTDGRLNTTAEFWQLSDGSALQITNARTLDLTKKPLPEFVTPNEKMADDQAKTVNTGNDALLERAYHLLKM